jgi:hypothetical protein
MTEIRCDASMLCIVSAATILQTRRAGISQKYVAGFERLSVNYMQDVVDI